MKLKQKILKNITFTKFFVRYNRGKVSQNGLNQSNQIICSL
jgi:hypothetical protein